MESELFAPALFAVILGVVAIAAHRLSGPSAWIDLGLRKSSIGWARVLACAALCFLAISASALILPPRESLPSVPGPQSVNILVVAQFLLLVVITPVVEEVFFRGAIQSGASARFGNSAGIAISTAFFAAIHIRSGWEVIAFAGWAGLCLALLATKLHSTRAGIGVHALHNTSAFFSMMLAGSA